MSSPLTLLDEPAPAGAPSVQLGENERVEVYGDHHRESGAGARARALVVVARQGSGTILRQPWLSVQDAELARGLAEAVRARHLRPGEPLVMAVDAAQAALVSHLEARGSPKLRMIEAKPVRAAGPGAGGGLQLPPPPEGITVRPMTGAEVAPFLDGLQESYSEKLMANGAAGGGGPSGSDPGRWRAAAAWTFERAVPQRGQTPGHSFLYFEDSTTGARLGEMWVALDMIMMQSFCYWIKVEEGYRRAGLGTKMVDIWERHAAEQRAVLLKLNVWGTNLIAQKLYHRAGFSIISTTFRVGP